MVYQESSSDSTSKKLEGSLLNAFIFVAMIVVVTFVLVLLFKYRCMKVYFHFIIIGIRMNVYLYSFFKIWDI